MDRETDRQLRSDLLLNSLMQLSQKASLCNSIMQISERSKVPNVQCMKGAYQISVDGRHWKGLKLVIYLTTFALPNANSHFNNNNFLLENTVWNKNKNILAVKLKTQVLQKIVV